MKYKFCPGTVSVRPSTVSCLHFPSSSAFVIVAFPSVDTQYFGILYSKSTLLVVVYVFELYDPTVDNLLYTLLENTFFVSV